MAEQQKTHVPSGIFAVSHRKNAGKGLYARLQSSGREPNSLNPDSKAETPILQCQARPQKGLVQLRTSAVTI
jgi:hypothetical protein